MSRMGRLRPDRVESGRWAQAVLEGAARGRLSLLPPPHRQVSIGSSTRFDRRYHAAPLPQLALDEIIDRSGYFDGFRVTVGDYLVIDPDLPESIGTIKPVVGQRITPTQTHLVSRPLCDCAKRNVQSSH